MTRFKFWYRWLLTVSLLSVLAGFLIAFLPDSALFEIHTTAIKNQFFEGRFPSGVNELRSFLFGPVGGTVAGYFILQTCIVWGPFYRRERWTWHAVFWALITWFIIDSGVSIIHDAWFNVWMINIWTLLLNGLPLVMTYKYFANEE